METEETKRNRGAMIISAPGTKPTTCSTRWIVDQLTVLAELLGETVSAQRLALSAQTLSDLSEQQLKSAFARAARECKFFPKPVELRELAEGKPEDKMIVEAEAAWNWIVGFMRSFWHPDVGIYQNSPKIPAQTEYALRQVGGFGILSQMENTSEPFIKRDFIAAYRRFPIAEQNAVSLGNLLPPLQSQVKQLAGTKTISGKPRVEDMNVARDRMVAAQNRKEDEAAERLERGRKRHQEQIEWLRKRGEL